mgnify:CR=1 FL=1
MEPTTGLILRRITQTSLSVAAGSGQNLGVIVYSGGSMREGPPWMCG